MEVQEFFSVNKTKQNNQPKKKKVLILIFLIYLFLPSPYLCRYYGKNHLLGNTIVKKQKIPAPPKFLEYKENW